MVDIILEAVLAVLLLGVIASCFVVSRKLSALRSGQDGLKRLIDQLNAATFQAQASVAKLKSEGAKAESDLVAATSRARTLADELTLIVQAADSQAGRIEAGLSQSRDDGTSARTAGDAESGASASPVPSELHERQDILEALREIR